MKLQFIFANIFAAFFMLHISVQAQELTQPSLENSEQSIVTQDEQVRTKMAGLQAEYARGELDAVWKKLLTLRDSAEGVYEFDVLYGEVALKKNQVSEALFALERATYINPEDDNVRLLLVQAYVANKNLLAAHAQLNLIESKEKIATLPLATQKLLSESATKINADKKLVKYASVGLGHDSNLNYGVESTPVFGNGNVPLFVGVPIVEQDSMFAASTVGVIKTHKNVTKSGKVWHRHYFKNSDSQTEVALQASAQETYDNASATAAIQIRPLWENEDYRRSIISVNTSMSLPVSKKFTLGSAVSYDYLLDDNKDARKRRLLVSSKANVQTHDNMQHNILVYRSAESADTSAAAALVRDINSASYAITYQQQNTRFGLSYMYSDIDYPAQDPVFLQSRKDHRHTLGLSVSKQLSNQRAIQFQHKYQNNNSNLDLYEFDRHLTTMKLIQGF